MLKYMGRLLKNKKIRKKMKHQFNRTLHANSCRQIFKIHPPPPHYFEARDVSGETESEHEFMREFDF